MHEYSIVASLVEGVAHEMSCHPRAVVRRVSVRIGEHSGVEIELLTDVDELLEGVGAVFEGELSMTQAQPGAFEGRLRATKLGTASFFSLTTSPFEVRAPTLGEQSEKVLRQLLGYDAAKIAALREGGALG